MTRLRVALAILAAVIAMTACVDKTSGSSSSSWSCYSRDPANPCPAPPSRQ